MSKKKSTAETAPSAADGSRIPTVFDLELFDYIPKSRMEQKKDRFLTKLNKIFEVFQKRGAAASKKDDEEVEVTHKPEKTSKKSKGATTAASAPPPSSISDPLGLEKSLGEDAGYIVDVRDAGTIIRASGINITEAQLMEIIEQVEDPESTGTLSSHALKRTILKILITNDLNGTIIVRNDEARIIRAFETLDQEKRGYLDAEFLREVMTSMGDRFSTEEVAEMISASAEPETGRVYYEDFAALMAVDDPIS